MLFSQSEYFECNDIPNIVSFHWPNEKEFKVRMHVSIENGLAFSLPKAPYAGFELRSILSQSATELMLIDLNKFLSERNIRELKIRQAPCFLWQQDYLPNDLLIQDGFALTEETNHHIVLKNPTNRFSKMQLRRVRKCKKEGLIFTPHSQMNPDLVYAFLSKCRAQQNLKVNLSETHFEKLLSELSEHYQVHTVTKQSGQMLACLVTIQVAKHVIYSFLPAFDRAFSELSPLAFLFHEYSELLSKSNIRILDLGLSSIDGKPQEGLILFKEGIGGIRSKRYMYHKRM